MIANCFMVLSSRLPSLRANISAMTTRIRRSDSTSRTELMSTSQFPKDLYAVSRLPGRAGTGVVKERHNRRNGKGLPVWT